MDGILNIYKEKGFTSHDVVAVVRRTINQKKVGHTGTLDPEAEGVLPICLGKATKLADYIMAEKKVYQAQLTLGTTTTTQDHTGEILCEKEFEFDEEKIREAVNSFIGEYDQIPPMYSAIKIKGRKLYELARQGQEIERKPRRIQIFDIKITDFCAPDKVLITVICQKGTYIRTLCADIGEKLGCGGHMSALIRTQSGAFCIENSITLSALQELIEKGLLSNALISMEEALCSYKKVFVDKKAEKLLQNGGRIFSVNFEKITGELIQDETVLAFDSNKKLIGLYCVDRSNQNELSIRPLRIF